jgi:hypothetical protein
VAVSETPTGWYQDDEDPSLARWWDGERWTEHTMAVPPSAEPVDGPSIFASSAEAPAPAPPIISSTRFPLPGGVVPSDFEPVTEAQPIAPFEPMEDDHPFFSPEQTPDAGQYRGDWLGAAVPAHRRPDDGDRPNDFASRVRAWPVWARIGMPVLAIALIAGLAVAAASSMGSSGNSNANTGGSSSSSSTTAVTFLPLGTAVPTPTLDSSTTTSTSLDVSTSATAPPRTTTTTRPATTTTAPTTTTTAPTTTTTVETTTTTIDPCSTTVVGNSCEP